MRKIVIIVICIIAILLIVYPRNSHSLSKLDREKSNVTKYLEEVYPDEQFEVSVEQEYTHRDTYSGYKIIRTATDSKGNSFQILKRVKGIKSGLYSDYYYDNR